MRGDEIRVAEAEGWRGWFPGGIRDENVLKPGWVTTILIAVDGFTVNHK